MNIENTLWVEKYRPKTLDDLVLPDEYRVNFHSYIKNRDIPHLLLYGPQGSGKTTIGLILCSKTGIIDRPQDNVLKINGSSQSSRGIGFVDNVIIPFLKIPPNGRDRYRIVFIDEADNLTEAAFKSLRGTIEEFTETGRFIFTCNYVSKIPDPVQSRFEPYMFKQVPIDYVMTYAKNILDSEKIQYKEEDVKYIVESVFPDNRQIVQFLQKFSVTGKLVVKRDVTLVIEKLVETNIIDVIEAVGKDSQRVNKSVNSILEIIQEQELNYVNIYERLFFNPSIPISAKVVINKAANSHNGCLIPHMHFLSMVYDIIKSLSHYKSGIQK